MTDRNSDVAVFSDFLYSIASAVHFGSHSRKRNYIRIFYNEIRIRRFYMGLRLSALFLGIDEGPFKVNTEYLCACSILAFFL